MSEHKENVPKLRFPGFSEAWEERKLSDLMSFSNGINAPKQSYGKGRKMISVMDILSKEPLTYNKIRGSVTVDDKVEQKNKVEKGDLVFVRSSEIREEVGWSKAYLEEEYSLYSGFTIRGKKKSCYDAYFIELSLNYINRKQIENNAGGSTRFNVSQGILNNIIFLEPTYFEQIKISGFFEELDNNIILHQRKLSEVRKLKAGLLQKMFPKNGEDSPEVRFPGFTDAWEQRELCDLANFTKGSGYTKIDLRDIGSPIILYGRLYTNYEVLIEDVDTFVDIKENSVISLGGEVIVPSSGESAEDISRASVVKKNGIILGGDLNIITPNELIDPVFLALAISNGEANRDMIKRAQGKSVVHLRNSDLQKINLKFPHMQEQRRIVEVHLNLDHLISLHQRKLEHLQEQKKALLQQMFV